MNFISWVSRKSRFIFLYALVAALIFSGFKLLQDRSWFLGLFFFVSSFLIIYIYAISRKIPGKYLLPGVLLLILFQIYPSFYSGVVAFTNDSNGHQLNKEPAINAIIEEYALFLEDKVYFSQMMSSMDKYLVLLEQEPQLFQRIPLTYIASFLGISRETLSRLRAK